jgi:hypothetical protein
MGAHHAQRVKTQAKPWYAYPAPRARTGPLGSISARFRSDKKFPESPPEASSEGASSFRPPRPGGSAAVSYEPTARTDDRREQDYLNYFTDRTRWHQQRARRRSLSYFTVQIISLGAAAAIPVAVAADAPQLAAALFAFVTVIAQGLQQLLRYHEKAVAHENAAAALARELRRYHQGVEPYDNGANDLDLLKRNIEEAIARYELSYADTERQEQSARSS